MSSYAISVDGEEYEVIVAEYSVPRGTDLREVLGYVENAGSSGIHVVLINPDIVVDPVIVAIAFQYALRAFKRGKNISRYVPVEVLLYLAGTREIRKALRHLRPREPLEGMVVAFAHTESHKLRDFVDGFEDKFGLKPAAPGDEDIASRIEGARKFYGISDEELRTTYSKDVREALAKLIAIRSALLAVS